jgi:hypothetical protein
MNRREAKISGVRGRKDPVDFCQYTIRQLSIFKAFDRKKIESENLNLRRSLKIANRSLGQASAESHSALLEEPPIVMA